MMEKHRHTATISPASQSPSGGGQVVSTPVCVYIYRRAVKTLSRRRRTEDGSVVSWDPVAQPTTHRVH